MILPDGNVDFRKGLPYSGVLLGPHEVNGHEELKLGHYSHPDMPNGTWGV
jgi:hypothetical protein